MILGLEIVLSLLGIWMLCTGKGWGKQAVKHWQYRLLGGILITLLPVALVAILIFTIVYAATHPGLSEDQLTQALKWPATGIEFGICITYAITCTFWESRIRRKVAAQNELAATEIV